MGICEINKDGHWAVDGTPIYTPTTAVITNSGILSSDSKRAESGKQYLTWIRPTYKVIKITFAMITAEEVSVLHDLMQGKDFDFTFYDNGIKTIRAFAKKDSYSLHRIDVHPECGGIYKNYSIDIEEV